ncbi:MULTISPECIES: PEP/pyruvate-binding domain-containing protein [unclassified Dyella]|uniref:PEP/pyruvate-binding domain-containing protein n=1 Tax=unclassified Dyella TaxID=2634549 RepID=UPI000C82C1EF|nr:MULTISPECIES: PEP/pyruvate-binding domain-containing protein [unclassified Dyella]MDR3446759.1 PEP/pyruvate-binding domain-containing protein [Dyella sp.]PMQ03206.1 Phosphoenolpyruvate synthase [Dyella sp. AD56]
MTYLFALTDPRATDVASSGGKGASLAQAAQHLPVPPGIVVSSDVYRAFVAPLRDDLAGILGDENLDHDARSQRIRALLLAHPLPAGLEQALAAAIDEAGLHGPVAVRSSGTMEDLPGAAFAGQHDTFLGVRGTAAIAQAIRACYASLWNAHVLPYRERMGLNHLDAAMAVVVQSLVQVGVDEAAGVAFSIDPVRGELDQVLINASFGLGETVVAGESPVDEFRQRRSDFGDTEASVAEKTHALIADEANGTRHVELPAEQRQRASLDESQRQAVARLAVAAEAHFGFPQDVEWAWQNGSLYLLQSRAITRVPAHWTRDESAERFPNPMTPLTWDLCEEGFHASLNHSFRLMGLPPFGDKWFVMRDYYIYGNQNAVRLYSGRTPTRMLKDVESVRAALPQIASQFAWVQELPVTWMRDLDTYLIEIGSLMRESLEGLPLPALWDYVMRINALGTRYFLPNIAISLTQRTLYTGLLQMLKLALPPEQAQEVFDRLLAVTDTKTGQVNAELWALSRLARADATLAQAMETLSGHELVQLLPSHPAFAREFATFLQRHGHRELDFDAYHPTWIEAPHIVLDQLKILCQRSDEDRAATERRQKIAQAAMEHRVLSEAPEELRYLVHEVIRLARVYTALDDMEHYQTTRLTLPLRRGLRAIGERLVQAGVLTDASDIYFIPLRILDAAMREQHLEAIPAAVAEHKQGYEAAGQRIPDWVHGEHEEPDTDNNALKGLGGSPGVIEGAVFVVNGPEDFARFPKDTILVARTTNPAWTPLFYQAIGIITESGGPLSHGAVTARELGLPAVMSVRNVTRLLRNGERVRVDGRNGQVVRLDV